LHALRGAEDKTVPWHRVINARGEISLSEFSGADLQRKLLRAEGVTFDRHHRINLNRFLWDK